MTNEREKEAQMKEQTAVREAVIEDCYNHMDHRPIQNKTEYLEYYEKTQTASTTELSEIIKSIKH